MRRICTFLIQKIKCLIVFIVHFDTLLGFPVFSCYFIHIAFYEMWKVPLFKHANTVSS